MKIIYTPHFPDNPYQTLLHAECEKLGLRLEAAKGVWFLSRVLRRRPDLVHFHWLHPFYIGRTPLRSVLALGLFLLQWPLLRLSGARIIWTGHNLGDHEGRMHPAETLTMRLVSRAASRIIVHCPTAGERLLGRYPWIPAEKVAVVPHGSYIGVYPEGIGREAARRQLELPARNRVVLFLGEVRAYKGVVELAEAFSEPGAPARTELLIAGRVHDAGLQEALEARARSSPAIRLHLGYVPDDRIQLYMAAADVVATPFRAVLTSGSLILALSFGKAVIAPRVGCITDLANDAAGFFYDPEDPDGLAEALREFAEGPADTEAMGRTNRAIAESSNWPLIARLTREVYEQALQEE